MRGLSDDGKLRSEQIPVSSGFPSKTSRTEFWRATKALIEVT